MRATRIASASLIGLILSGVGACAESGASAASGPLERPSPRPSAPNTSTIVVAIATTSANPANIDPDGYTVRVDGITEIPTTTNGTFSISIPYAGVDNHELDLDGVSGNCSVSGGFAINVLARAGQSNTASFSVSCEDPAPFEGVLAFVSERGGSPEIYTINADGSGLKKLTNHQNEWDDDLAWSPDGKRLAFVRGDALGHVNIYVMNADGSNVIQRTHEGGTSPTWSPDGRKIAFSGIRNGQFSILTVDVDGDWNSASLIGPAGGKFPAWSPDNKRIAFSTDAYASEGVNDLYDVNVDGSAMRRLIQARFGPNPIKSYLKPAWSPDGRKISVVTCGDSDDCSGQTAIELFTSDGTWLTTLDRSRGYSSVTWSPDGQFIAYSDAPCAACAVAIRYASTDRTRRGTLVANAHSPAWRP